MTADDLPPSQRPTQEVVITDALRPSEVLAVIAGNVIEGRMMMPLCDTFGRAELEAAAYYLTLACMRQGDTYGPIGFSDVADMFRARYEQDPWLRNPFFQPDFDALVEYGFASWVSEHPRQLMLTPLAIGKLREFMQRSA